MKKKMQNKQKKIIKFKKERKKNESALFSLRRNYTLLRRLLNILKFKERLIENKVSIYGAIN